jgi:hypothetical protein
MTEHSYGWIKDKFNPCAIYHEQEPIQIAPVVNNLAYCPPVRDQGQEGSCTGFGISAHAYTIAKAGNFATSIYSPQYLYNGARFIEGSLTQDAGANPDDVFDWAIAHGLLYEQYWPYHDVPFDKSAPSSLRESEAMMYPGIAKIRVDGGLQGILSALNTVPSVAIGAPWANEWVSGSTGILPTPKSVDGGHETCYYGYDNNAGFLYCQNSWGTGWSDGGRCKIPFSAVAWWLNNGGYDCHYFAFNNIPTPPVPPTPPSTSATFNLSLIPASAVLTINGAILKNPPASFQLNPGKYLFRATFKGYKPEQKTIHAVAGGNYPIIFDLMKSKLCIYN